MSELAIANSENIGFSFNKFVQLKFPENASADSTVALDVFDINNINGLFVASKGPYVLIDSLKNLHSLINLKSGSEDGDNEKDDDDDVKELTTSHLITLNAEVKFLKITNNKLLIAAENLIIAKLINDPSDIKSIADLNVGIELITIEDEEILDFKLQTVEHMAAALGSKGSLFIIDLQINKSRKIHTGVSSFAWSSVDANIIYVAFKEDSKIIKYSIVDQITLQTIPQSIDINSTLIPIALSEIDRENLLVTYDVSGLFKDLNDFEALDLEHPRYTSYTVNIKSKDASVIDEEFCSNSDDSERDFKNYVIRLKKWPTESNQQNDDLLLVTSSVGTYISVLNSKELVVPLEDDQRAAIPMDPSTYDDLFVSGMAVDLLTQELVEEIPNFEDNVSDLPCVWIFTTSGLLAGFDFFDADAVRNKKAYAKASYQLNLIKELKASSAAAQKSVPRQQENGAKSKGKAATPQIKSPFASKNNKVGEVANPFSSSKPSVFSSENKFFPSDGSSSSPFGNTKSGFAFHKPTDDAGDAKVGFGKLGFESSTSQKPINGEPKSGFGQSGFGSSGFGNSEFGKSEFGKSGFGNSGFGNSGFGKSGFGNSGFGNSGFGKSGFGQSGFGQSDKPKSGQGSLFGGPDSTKQTSKDPSKLAFGLSGFSNSPLEKYSTGFSTSLFDSFSKTSNKSSFENFNKDKQANELPSGKPGNIFGQSTNSNKPKESPFGQSTGSNKSKESLFPKPTVSGALNGSLFGQPNSSEKSSGSLFGQPTGSEKPEGPLFGASSNSAGFGAFLNKEPSANNFSFPMHSSRPNLEELSEQESESDDKSSKLDSSYDSDLDENNDGLTSSARNQDLQQSKENGPENLCSLSPAASEVSIKENTKPKLSDNTATDHHDEDDSETLHESKELLCLGKKEGVGFKFAESQGEETQSEAEKGEYEIEHPSDNEDNYNEYGTNSKDKEFAEKKDVEAYTAISKPFHVDVEVQTTRNYVDAEVKATRTYIDTGTEPVTNNLKDEEILSFMDDEQYLQNLRVSKSEPEHFDLTKVNYPPTLNKTSPITNQLEKAFYDTEAEYQALIKNQHAINEFIEDHSHIKNQTDHRYTTLKNIYTWRLSETSVLTELTDKKFAPQIEQLYSQLEKAQEEVKKFKSTKFKQFVLDYESFIKDFEVIEINSKLLGSTTKSSRTLPVEFSLLQQKIRSKFKASIKLFEELEDKVLILKSNYQIAFSNEKLSSSAKAALFSKFSLAIRKIDVSLKAQMEQIFELLKDVSNLKFIDDEIKSPPMPTPPSLPTQDLDSRISIKNDVLNAVNLVKPVDMVTTFQL